MQGPGVDGPIHFPPGSWDESVQEGDSVDVIISERHPFFGGYNGKSIDDGES